MCDVSTKDTIRDNIAVMTSKSRVYSRYLLVTIIK